MSISNFLINRVWKINPFIEVLAVIVPLLLGVAFMTIIERKVLAGMQRRVGPNTVGAYGVLQPFIHDFRVPSLGLKIDATPGRLNQTSVLAQREGVYYGQCSELCGVYHGFMPISVEVVGLDDYLEWLDSQT